MSRKKKKEPPYDGPPYERRLQMYAPLLSSGHTYEQMSNRTGVPVGTIKSDMYKARQAARKDPRAPRRAVDAMNPVIPTTTREPNVPARPPSFDWTAQLDRAGSAILGLFSRALQEGREDDAMKWMDRFLRGVQVKLGAGVRYELNAQNIQVNAVSLTQDAGFRTFARALHIVLGRIQRKYGIEEDLYSEVLAEADMVVTVDD